MDACSEQCYNGETRHEQAGDDIKTKANNETDSARHECVKPLAHVR